MQFVDLVMTEYVLIGLSDFFFFFFRSESMATEFAVSLVEVSLFIFNLKKAAH